MAQHVVGHAVYIDTDGASPALIGDLTAAQRRFTLVDVTHPDFRLNEVEESNGRHYDLPVDHKLPIQELPVTIAGYDDAVLANAMRPFQQLGAVADNAGAETAGEPALAIVYEIQRDEDGQRRSVKYSYRGRVVSADLDGVTPDGLTRLTALFRPVMYKKVERTDWFTLETGNTRPNGADWEIAREIDLLEDKYEVNGLNLWAASAAALTE